MEILFEITSFWNSFIFFEMVLDSEGFRRGFRFRGPSKGFSAWVSLLASFLENLFEIARFWNSFRFFEMILDLEGFWRGFRFRAPLKVFAKLPQSTKTVSRRNRRQGRCLFLARWTGTYLIPLDSYWGPNCMLGQEGERNPETQHGRSNNGYWTPVSKMNFCDGCCSYELFTKVSRSI